MTLFMIFFRQLPLGSLFPFNEILPQNTFEELVILGTVFIILLVCGIYLILNIRKSLKSPEEVSNDEQLLRFSQLYDSGVLTKDEFRQIKLRFARVIKEQDGFGGSGVKKNKEAKMGKKNKKKKKSSADREAILRSLLEERDN